MVLALPGVTISSLDDVEHLVYRAYKWLTEEDALKLCPNDPSFMQRYILAVFYYYTTGDKWAKCRQDGLAPCDGQNFLSGSSECEWGGVTCNKSQQVQKLNLGKRNQNFEVTKIEVCD